jgi:hypothetical protein
MVADNKEISSDKIRTLGDQIGDLKTGIDPVIGQLQSVNVQPGDFEDATKLQTTVHQRRDEVVAYLKSVGQQLEDIKATLHKSADKYDGTEEDNAQKAKY